MVFLALVIQLIDCSLVAIMASRTIPGGMGRADFGVSIEQLFRFAL